MSEPFNILTVCTGNICRSPLAEQLLAQALAHLPFVKVSSAGTQALVGSTMAPKSQAIAAALGIENAAEHHPRRLTEQLLQESDLILAMDRGHKKAIVELNPRVTKRVFTLREFARLADATTSDDLAQDVTLSEGAGRLKQVVTAVGLGRGLLPPLEDPADADVIDPYRQSDEVYQTSTNQIVPAVQAAAQILTAEIT